MTRRKVDRSAKLIRRVTIRMSDSFYKRMEEWLKNSNCQTLSELARRILYREEIIWYHKDESLETAALELAGVRKELNAIGKNINQITHRFHISDTPTQKLVQAIKVSKEYEKVGQKVETVLAIASQISKKWLQS